MKRLHPRLFVHILWLICLPALYGPGAGTALSADNTDVLTFGHYWREVQQQRLQYESTVSRIRKQYPDADSNPRALQALQEAEATFTLARQQIASRPEFSKVVTDPEVEKQFWQRHEKEYQQQEQKAKKRLEARLAAIRKQYANASENPVAKLKIQQVTAEYYQQSRHLAATYQKDIQDMIRDELNRKVRRDVRRNGSKVSAPIRNSVGSGYHQRDRNGAIKQDSNGRPLINPGHRGHSGDTDVEAGARTADARTIRKILEQKGLRHIPVDDHPGYVSIGEGRHGINLTINKTGEPFGPEGSSAHETKIQVDAESRETYVHVSMDHDQPGRSYVAVQDHKKKALEGLMMDPGALVDGRHSEALQGMAKGTLKAMNEARLSNRELRKIIEKHRLRETPQSLRAKLARLKEGQAIAPDGVGLNRKNIGAYQQASRDILAAAERRSRQQKEGEFAKAESLVKKLQASSVPEDRQKAIEMKKKLIDSRVRVRAVEEANRQRQKQIARGGEVASGPPQETKKSGTRQKAMTGPVAEAGATTSGNTLRQAMDSSRDSKQSKERQVQRESEESVIQGRTGIIRTRSTTKTIRTAAGNETTVTRSHSEQKGLFTSGSSELTHGSKTVNRVTNSRTREKHTTRIGPVDTSEEKRTRGWAWKSGTGRTEVDGKVSRTTKKIGSTTVAHSAEAGIHIGGKFREGDEPAVRNRPNANIKIWDSTRTREDSLAETKDYGARRFGQHGEVSGSYNISGGYTKYQHGTTITIEPDGSVKVVSSQHVEADALRINTQGKVEGKVGSVGVTGEARGEFTFGGNAGFVTEIQAGPNSIATRANVDVFAGMKADGEVSTTLDLKDHLGIAVKGSLKAEVSAGAGFKAGAEAELSWTTIKMSATMAATLGLGGGGQGSVEIDASVLVTGVDLAKVAQQDAENRIMAEIIRKVKNGQRTFPPGKTWRDMLPELHTKVAWLARHPELLRNNKRRVNAADAILDKMRFPKGKGKGQYVTVRRHTKDWYCTNRPVIHSKVAMPPIIHQGNTRPGTAVAAQ